MFFYFYFMGLYFLSQFNKYLVQMLSDNLLSSNKSRHVSQKKKSRQMTMSSPPLK